jgi:hypothetical protein
MARQIGKNVTAWLACIALGGALTSACSSATSSNVPSDEPYDSCDPGDDCRGGLDCSQTTLPVSSGFSGNLCTSGCGSDSDCLQLVENFSAECINGQCYLTCPTGGDSCPYSQGCFTFDSNTGPVSLCTP